MPTCDETSQGTDTRILFELAKCIDGQEFTRGQIFFNSFVTRPKAYRPGGQKPLPFSK